MIEKSEGKGSGMGVRLDEVDAMMKLPKPVLAISLVACIHTIVGLRDGLIPMPPKEANYESLRAGLLGVGTELFVDIVIDRLGNIVEKAAGSGKDDDSKGAAEVEALMESGEGLAEVLAAISAAKGKPPTTH